MKKIVTDAQSNAYLFDGTKMEAMGKAEAFRDVYNGIIFAIGKDLYLKKGDEYCLLAANAKLFAFGPADPYAEKQFEIINGECLYVEPGVPGILRFPNNPAYAPMYTPEISNLQEKGFVIHSQTNGYRVHLLNDDGIVVLSDASALFCENALFWNGHGYLLKDGKFIRQPWKLFYQNDAYLLMELDSVLWCLYTNESIAILGRLQEKFPTQNGNILVTQENDRKHCYYLGENEPQCVVSVYNDEQNFRINQDGSIDYHEVFRMTSYDPDIRTFETYQLKDGTYQCVHREERW